MFSDAMVSPGLEIVELEELAIGFGGGASEHDALASDRISDFHTGRIPHRDRSLTRVTRRGTRRPAPDFSSSCRLGRKPLRARVFAVSQRLDYSVRPFGISKQGVEIERQPAIWRAQTRSVAS